MKTYGGVDVYIHIFLTSALVGGELSASRPGRFTSGKESPVAIVQEVGWTPELIWTIGEVKILDPTGTRTPTPRSSSP
jgi:hypothetical protein